MAWNKMSECIKVLIKKVIKNLHILIILMLITKHPVHYEMFGYDSLIGSHFDKYTIDYYNYDEKPIDSNPYFILLMVINYFILL